MYMLFIDFMLFYRNVFCVTCLLFYIIWVNALYGQSSVCTAGSLWLHLVSLNYTRALLRLGPLFIHVCLIRSLTGLNICSSSTLRHKQHQCDVAVSFTSNAVSLMFYMRMEFSLILYIKLQFNTTFIFTFAEQLEWQSYCCIVIQKLYWKQQYTGFGSLEIILFQYFHINITFKVQLTASDILY